MNTRSFCGIAFAATALLVAGCARTSQTVAVPNDAPSPIASSTVTPRATATALVFPTATPIPAAPFKSTRIAWVGQDWYLHGANLPWFNWGCDFGCGPGGGGASSAEVNSVISAAVSGAKANGLNVIRWWMFPGEPSQFETAADGAPTGLKAPVFQDIDAALRMASAQDIYFVFVFFSAPTAIPQAWTADEGQRAKLAGVLGGLAQRYSTDSHVLAWEVFNEPEWDIWGHKAAESDVVASVKRIASEIHQHSPALVTVGSATIEGLGMWADSGLDFYEPHWYDPMGQRACARCTDYASLRATYGIDRPVVIGEFFADRSVDAAQRYADFYEKGYAGAWGWSLFPDRTLDHLAVDLQAAGQFGALHADEGPKSR